MNRQSGAALIVVLLLTITLAMLGIGVASFATNQARYAFRLELGMRAFNMAEAGLHMAYRNLPNDPPVALQHQASSTLESVGYIQQEYWVLHKAPVSGSTNKYDVWTKGRAAGLNLEAVKYLKARVVKETVDGVVTVKSWREITPDELARDRDLGGW